MFGLLLLQNPLVKKYLSLFSTTGGQIRESTYVCVWLGSLFTKKGSINRVWTVML